MRETSGDQTPDKRPHPERHGGEVRTPFAGVVAKADLEGEVDQHSKRHVFLRETLVEELEVSDGVIGLEADLGDKVDDYEGLNVWWEGLAIDG